MDKNRPYLLKYQVWVSGQKEALTLEVPSVSQWTKISFNPESTKCESVDKNKP